MAMNLTRFGCTIPNHSVQISTLIKSFEDNWPKNAQDRAHKPFFK